LKFIVKNYAIGWYCHPLLKGASFEIDLGKPKKKKANSPFLQNV
jgi:hypothetical protein